MSQSSLPATMSTSSDATIVRASTTAFSLLATVSAEKPATGPTRTSGCATWRTRRRPPRLCPGTPPT
eukprot:2325190-Lingulodinium_polyedra.AAC.1